MSKGSFLEQLSKGLADAVADVREKYEESVYGRTVTEQQDAPVTAQQDEVPGWGSKVRQVEITPQEQQHEAEIER